MRAARLSREAEGIDVERRADAAARQRGDRGPPAWKKALHRAFLDCAREDLPALEAGTPRQRRGHGREHFDAVRMCARNAASRLARRSEETINRIATRRFGGEQRKARERRKHCRFPFRKQAFREAFVIMGDERSRERMRREVRLHDDFAGEIGAPRAARYLEQQRREALGRAEITAVERVVGAEHADERQPREVVTLGEHLRADQDIDLARVDALAHVGKGALAPRAVAIDALDARLRKALGERSLEPLRAVADGNEVHVAAVGTAAREPVGVTAMVTAQIRRLAMHDEPRAAARTSRLPAAGGAQERDREAAPVDENERLLAAREAGGDRFEKRCTPRGASMPMEIRAEMVANVWKVVVAQGDTVTDGDTLVILESMKMEIPVITEVSGKVDALHVGEGDVVQEGDGIAVIG